jgi:hypothetical protein
MKYFLNWELNNQMYSLGYNGDTLMFIDDEEDIINDDSSVLIGANPAILFSAAFRWFREKYGLYHSIALDNSLEDDVNCDYQIINHNQSISELETDFKSYEEAETECLKKLIEIVKQKHHATTN